MNVILCYNIEDGENADTLCDRLNTFGMTLWVDQNDSIGEQEWREKIAQAVGEGTYILFLLSSNSNTKNGLLHRKLSIAKESFGEDGRLQDFILLVRLDNCHLPNDKFSDIRYVDLFPSYEVGFRKILTFFIGEDGERTSDRPSGKVIDDYLSGEVELDCDPEEEPAEPSPPNMSITPPNQNVSSLPTPSSQQAPTKTAFKLRSENNVLPMDNILGRVDRYQLIEKLGSGGYGAVYRARDTIANIDIALKVLPHLLTNNKDELEDIRRNFSLVSRLRHQNIVTLLHLHEVQATDEKADKELGLVPGHYLTVMEYIPGVTIKAYLKQHDRQKVPLKEALDICLDIAEVLDYAHSKKIVHRDIKPSNIMLTPDREVKVLDFGLAAEIRSSMSRVSRNSTAVTGTFPYMSPEQWQGKRLTGRSDQYALAVVFHELVSGEIPFASIFTTTNDSRLMRETVLKQTPDRLTELSRKQNKILHRALAKNPHERYNSCQEFISGLAKSMPNKKALMFRQLLFGVLLIVSIVFLLAAGILKISTSHELHLVSPVKTKVEDRVEQLRSLDRSQGFASKIEEIDAVILLAERSIKEKNSQDALSLYQKALVLCDDAENVSREREKAKLTKNAMTKVQTKAELVDAPSHAAQKWQEADSLAASASNDFEAGDFTSAERKWNHAIEKFRSAERHAKRVQRIIDAERSYNEKLSKTNPKLLDAFGGDKWAKVQSSITKARELSDKGRVKESANLWEKALKLTSEVIQFVVGEQKLTEARNAADQAKAEAEKAKSVAESFKAQMYASTIWSEALSLMKTAEKYHQAEDLVQARKKWELAAGQFKQAETHAENIRRLLRAKSKYKSNLAKIDEKILYELGGERWEHTMLVVVEAEGFERNGMFNAALSKWDEASHLLSELIESMQEIRDDQTFVENLRQAREAKAGRDWKAVLNFSQTALALNPNSRKAKALKQAAEKHLAAKVTVVSLVDDQLIEGAKITVNGAVHDELTPSILTLEIGTMHQITVELAKEGETQYEPFETTFSATRPGSHTIRAVLTQVEGPEFNQQWIASAVKMEFVPIKPGTFKMGTRNGDDDETPQHTVHITETFWIGKYEVTQGEYQELMEHNPSNFRGLRNPVENVSWYEATEFCEKLTKIEKEKGQLPFGYVYRLPTEAEWEYCCRAGTDTEFYFGDSLDASMANFNGKYPYGNGVKGAYRKQTVAVNEFEPNNWNLYNTHGNVWEWCMDHCDWDSGVITDTYRENIKDPMSQRGPYRIIRGGNWRSFAGNCRSANRHVLRPASRNDGVGFRVVLAPDY